MLYSLRHCGKIIVDGPFMLLDCSQLVRFEFIQFQKGVVIFNVSYTTVPTFNLEKSGVRWQIL